MLISCVFVSVCVFVCLKRYKESVFLYSVVLYIMCSVSFCSSCWVWPLDTLVGVFQVIDQHSQFIQITILESGTSLFLKSQAMVWIRIDALEQTHQLTRTHTHSSARQHSSDPALLFLISSISPEKSACQRLCPNNKKSVPKKTTTTKKHILLHHCSSIHPVVNSLLIYGTLGRVIWIMRGMTKGGAVWKQQDDNHTKTTRGHMPTHRISVILSRFAPVGLLLCR